MSTTLRDAIAEIRAAALLAATLGANWRLPSDREVLAPVASALLIACEPVRLLAILDAAERALRASEQPAVPPVKQTPSYTVTTRPVGGWRLRCFDAAGVEVKGGAFDGGHSDADYLDAVEEGEAFLASLRGAEEINGASTAPSEEGQADGDRLAGAGPARGKSPDVLLEELQRDLKRLSRHRAGEASRKRLQSMRRSRRSSRVPGRSADRGAC